MHPAIIVLIYVGTVFFVIFMFFFLIKMFTKGFRFLDKVMGRDSIDKEFQIDSKRNR